jgi:hypothetical protein
MLWQEEVLPPFNGKYDLDVNLRVGIGHESKMSLLTELEKSFVLFLQICHAYGVTGGPHDVGLVSE